MKDGAAMTEPLSGTTPHFPGSADREVPAGPRLDDRTFFLQLVDTSRPGLEALPAAVERGDLAEARRIFAAEVRSSLQPQRFLTIKRPLRENFYMYPNETVDEAAERIVRLELISCATPHQFHGTVDWFINPTYNQYKEWTWQLSRHHEWAILAQRYRETGDERFAETFVHLFCSWVQQAVVPLNEPGSATLCWRTIEAGIRMGGAWQWALHSFYRSSYFNDDVLVDWYKSVWEHGWRLRNFHRSGNWLIMEMNGLAQISILYPQFRAAAAWHRYAFERLVQELDVQVYPDGFQYELSTGYHQVNINNYHWLWDVCSAYSQPVPDYFKTVLERMHAVNLLIMMPDGRLPDLNDGGWHDVSRLMGRAVQSFPHREDFRWAASRGAEGQPPQEISTAFGWAGYFTMRTGWQPDAVWVLFDGGPFGFGHQHEDKLNILLHAYGKLLLTEGGNYAYDASEMRRYVLSTRSHNTVRVDDEDQNRRLHFRREDVDITAHSGATWRYTPEYDLVAASYNEGYGEQADRSVTHTRKVILVKSEVYAPYVLVIDRFEAAEGEQHSYQSLWHLNTLQAVAQGTTAASSDADSPNLTIIAAGVPETALELVQGQESPEFQGWKAIKNHQQGEFAPTATAIYRWQAAGAHRCVTLLYPTPQGELCPFTGVAAASNLQDTRIELELAGGGTVILDESQFSVPE